MTLRDFFRTPLGVAIRMTLYFAAFGVVVRYVWGAFDPEMHSWALVKASPLVGGFVYLQASGRTRALAWTCVAGGLAALAFWAVAIGTGGLAVTSGIDWTFVAIIVAIPVYLTLFGLYLLRRLREA